MRGGRKMAEKKILKRPLTADEVSYFCYQLLQVLDPYMTDLR